MAFIYGNLLRNLLRKSYPKTLVLEMHYLVCLSPDQTEYPHLAWITERLLTSDTLSIVAVEGSYDDVAGSSDMVRFA